MLPAMCIRVSEAYYEFTASSQSTPERVLLAAILWRAYWDLQPESCYTDRISAIRWFENDPNNIYPFPYNVVADILELSAKYQELIRDAVYSAKYKCENVGEKPVKKNRSLGHGSRYRVCV